MKYRTIYEVATGQLNKYANMEVDRGTIALILDYMDDVRWETQLKSPSVLAGDWAVVEVEVFEDGTII